MDWRSGYRIMLIAKGIEIFSYLITPSNVVLRDNVTGSQLVKKFAAFYGTRVFITSFTSALHLYLS
jgi:hypothetical protein